MVSETESEQGKYPVHNRENNPLPIHWPAKTHNVPIQDRIHGNMPRSSGSLKRATESGQLQKDLNRRIEEDRRTRRMRENREGRKNEMDEGEREIERERERRESGKKVKRESFFLGEENNVTRPGFHGPQERYSGFQGGICSEGQKKKEKEKRKEDRNWL